MSKAYKIISNFYGTKRAERSNVPLMNHINEGLVILDYYMASHSAKDAFCLHPVVQKDSDLVSNLTNEILDVRLNARTMAYAMEYRRVANAYLLEKYNSEEDVIELSPINEVNLMLKADKIQNRKDFLRYHYGTHERSEDLGQYFKNWLKALGVSEDEYASVVKLVDTAVSKAAA